MNYSIVSRYRVQIMGFATLWIALLHSTAYFDTVSLEFFKETGHFGVGIFLFLSSFGLYYSYQKCNQKSRFIWKRLIRILPTFWCIEILRCLYMKFNFTHTILTLTTMNFWLSEDRSTWFVSVILILYIATPFYLSWLTKGEEEKKTGIAIICTLFLAVLFKNTQWMIVIANIPVYLLGFLIGKFSNEEKSIQRKELVIFTCMFMIGMALTMVSRHLDTQDMILWGYGMYWYPGLLLILPICLGVARTMQFFENHQVIVLSKFLAKIGQVSLEFYLLHEVSIIFWSNIFTVTERYSYHHIIFNILVGILTYILSRMLHDLHAAIIKGN